VSKKENFVEVTSFVEAFGSWARAQADIEAAALVGSHARDSATEESDVDLMILTTGVASYFENRSWISRFGDVGECKVENWGRVKSLRAFYKDGTEVEYNFSTPDWADVPVEEGTYHVIANGMKIIYDPQGVLKALQESVL
jgi:predicted nucleotidyltransferase